MSTDTAIELAAVYEAASGHAPDPGFPDRVRAILSGMGYCESLPEYIFDALKHLASGELVAPTQVASDLHGLSFYLGCLENLFPGAEFRTPSSDRDELFFPRLARSVVVDRCRGTHYHEHSSPSLGPHSPGWNAEVG
jgi:hypothetical protein